MHFDGDILIKKNFCLYLFGVFGNDDQSSDAGKLDKDRNNDNGSRERHVPKPDICIKKNILFILHFYLKIMEQTVPVWLLLAHISD